MSLIRFGFAGALCATIIPSSVTAQDEPLSLPPSSDWVLEYAEDNCALRRSFGSDERMVWLELRQLTPGYSVQVWLSAIGIDRRFGVDDDVSGIATGWYPDPRMGARDQVALVQLGTGAEGYVFQEYLGFFLPDSAGEARDLEPSERLRYRQEYEARTEGYAVAGAFDHNIRLQTGPMDQALGALRICMDDLLLSMGIDPEVNRNLSQGAEARNLSRWSREIRREMPSNIYRDRSTASVSAQLVVEPDGSVSACRIVMPIVAPEYEERTCAVFVDRGQFNPALNADGQPVRTVFIQGIRYDAEDR